MNLIVAIFLIFISGCVGYIIGARRGWNRGWEVARRLADKSAKQP